MSRECLATRSILYVCAACVIYLALLTWHATRPQARWEDFVRRHHCKRFATEYTPEATREGWRCDDGVHWR